MDMSKGLEPNLAEFLRICNDLSNIREGINDKNLTHLLLYNLPDSYKEVKMGLNYERYDISLDLVIYHLRMRELELTIEKLHINKSGVVVIPCIHGVEVEKEAKEKEKGKY